MLRGFLLFVFTLALIGIGAISLMPLLWRWVPQSVALVPRADRLPPIAAGGQPDSRAPVC